ncbi:MAG: hypothetical protein ACLFNT_14020 [Spirochaetales bacterium]
MFFGFFVALLNSYGTAQRLPTINNERDDGVTFTVTYPRSALDQVIEFRKLPRWHALSPIVLGTAYRLRWRDENGRDRRLTIGMNAELENSDRLRALIELALDARRPVAPID